FQKRHQAPWRSCETAVIPLVQSDNHHVQANLPAAKTTTHTIRNRNIETAKLACFLNSLRPSLIRVVRRKKIERMKRKMGIAAARKAMILKIILSVLLRGPCPFHEANSWGARGHRAGGFFCQRVMREFCLRALLSSGWSRTSHSRLIVVFG